MISFWNRFGRRLVRLAVGLTGWLALSAVPAGAADLGDRDAAMWEYAEWRLAASRYVGNPFDVIARVTFTHLPSGARRTTQMFHTGGDQWRFRFTGTRLGEWRFTSESRVADLHGHTGTVTVGPNPDPAATGFLTAHGSKYAVQTTDADTLRAFRFNVFQVEDGYLDKFGDDPAGTARRHARAAKEHGMSAIAVKLNNGLLAFGTRRYDKHDSETPDLRSFAILDEIIATARQEGMRVHFWAWGDQQRKWTPVGLRGGINGRVDRRLQRYIAARLGPLPGWTMGYGFDLFEWVRPKQLNDWAGFLRANFGWQHLLSARGFPLGKPGGPTVNSYASLGRDHVRFPLRTTTGGPSGYDEVAEDIAGDRTRPHFYEERHVFRREGFDLDMEGSRRLLWWQTMAGGVGGWFGFFDRDLPTLGKPVYPRTYQLRTAAEFWDDRERFLLGMQPANDLTDGLGLGLKAGTHFVFYKEDAETVRVDLSGAPRPLPAVAVDTRIPYREVDLGLLEYDRQTIRLPYGSDWAIAVGRFRAGSG